MKRVKLNKISRGALKKFAWEFTRVPAREEKMLKEFTQIMKTIQNYINADFPERHRSVLQMYQQAEYADSFEMSLEDAPKITMAADGSFKFERDHTYSWQFGTHTKTEQFLFDEFLEECCNNGWERPRVQINPLKGEKHQYPITDHVGIFTYTRNLEEDVEAYRLLLDKKRAKYVKLIQQATYCDEVLKYWPKCQHVLDRFINPGQLMIVTPLLPDEIKAMEEENS